MFDFDKDKREPEWLSHYGRKGMRWGQRIFSKDSQTVSTPKKDAGRRESLRDVSTKDLQARIQRLELENRYSSLLGDARERNKSSFSRGVSTVNSMLAASGKKAVQGLLDEQVKILVKRGTAVAQATKKPSQSRPASSQSSSVTLRVASPEEARRFREGR